MDLASIIGFLGCIAAVVYGISSGDEGIAALGNFYDFPSILITIGGSVMCIMITCGSPKDFISNFLSIRLVLKSQKTNEVELMQKIIELSNVARKEGLLALEEASGEIDDDFLKKGILLIVDGTDPELVRNIMETELSGIERRHGAVCGFWDCFAGFGPAWGMIGTLIGLINMLKKLDDPASIGPSMSVALITTLYGSLIANWLCSPTSSKLKAKNDKEVMIKEVIVEGLLSIQAGENPRVIEEKLKSFLAPSLRVQAVPEEGGES